MFLSVHRSMLLLDTVTFDLIYQIFNPTTRLYVVPIFHTIISVSLKMKIKITEMSAFPSQMFMHFIYKRKNRKYHYGLFIRFKIRFE